MTRFTTPTLLLRIPIDLTGKQIFVTFEQPKRELTKSGDDIVASYDSEIGKTVMQVALTQQETAMFCTGECLTQINWISSDGVRGASRKKRLRIHENLLDREVYYE